MLAMHTFGAILMVIGILTIGALMLLGIRWLAEHLFDEIHLFKRNGKRITRRDIPSGSAGSFVSGWILGRWFRNR